jgi:hypothetical protein
MGACLMPTGRKASGATPGAAPRKRSGSYVHAAQRSTVQVQVRFPREQHARLLTIAEEADGMSVQEWIREAVDWHERRSRKRPQPGPDDLDAGNPLER